MAVRHGYGKIAGADALVFAYDTGDTRNSYRGEPTTNLLPNGVAAGHNSGGYGNVVTVTDATTEKGPGWKKVTISNRGSNFRIIQWTYLSMSANIMYCHSVVFDWGNMRDKGYFIYFDGTGTGTRSYYRPGDYVNTGSTNINSTMPDGKFAGTITHTASHLHAFFIGNYTTGVSGLDDYFYYKEYQVEVNSHPTQYTASTRSSTQGLLDLTGNRTIDLANVSFDSNSQVTFDGTNDYLSFPYTQSNPNLFSVETVFYHTAHSSDTNIGHILVMPYNGSNAWIYSLNGTDSKLQLRHHNYSASSTSYNVAYTTGLDLNKWYHTVATDDGTNVKLYVNGELVKTQASATSTTNGTMTCKVGSWPTSNTSFAGDIPVVKIYNRALTADEVRNNYNLYRTRFNI